MLSLHACFLRSPFSWMGFHCLDGLSMFHKDARIIALPVPDGCSRIIAMDKTKWNNPKDLSLPWRWIAEGPNRLVRRMTPFRGGLGSSPTHCNKNWHECSCCLCILEFVVDSRSCLLFCVLLYRRILNRSLALEIPSSDKILYGHGRILSCYRRV